MTGNDAMRIAQQSLRWVEADQRRRDARGQARALEDQQDAGAELARKYARSAAATAAGYRRGLVSMCRAVLAKGVAEKGVRREDPQPL